MLNALVARHPSLAGVHPMTWAESVRARVLCGSRFDTVLALGGSASYLTPEEIPQLQMRALRGVLLMHFGPGNGPVTDDLEPSAAAESLAAATEVATEQTRVGRFVASLLPPIAAH